MSGYSIALHAQHAQMLADSGISPARAAERGYITVDTKKRLGDLGVVKAGRQVPGMLVPMLGIDGTTWGHQYRPDAPRLRDGKTVKYETPVGQRNAIDVPPGVAVQLDDPGVPLWITEGVKKADAAAEHGLCCIALPGVWSWLGTNDKGGKTALPQWRDIALNGRLVVLAFDSDVVVNRQVQGALLALAQYLESRGALVEYAHLPDDGNGKTGLDDFLISHAVADLGQLVRPNLPGPPIDADCLAPTTGSKDKRPSSGRLRVVRADSVQLSRVAYLWDGFVPVGTITIMPGEEGVGKTTVCIRLIADLTCGALSGEFYGIPRDVIVTSPEDGIAEVFVPRLQEAGADLTRVHFVVAHIGQDDVDEDVVLPRDLDLITGLVREHHAALLYIDSLVTTLPDDLNTRAYKDTAKVLRKIGDWAREQRVAVLSPWHLNKASGNDTALRMMDSRGFRTAARSVLLVVPDPDSPEGVTQGVIALDKTNSGTLTVPALRYRIREAHYTLDEVDTDTGEISTRAASCGVVEWAGVVDGDGRAIARAALTPSLNKDDGPKEWLRAHLENDGESSREDVLAAAEKAKFSKDSIKRAMVTIGGHSRDVSGYDEEKKVPWRRSLWSLPGPHDKKCKLEATPPTAPTPPTRPDSLPLLMSPASSSSESVQSVQSAGDHPTRVAGVHSKTWREADGGFCLCGAPIERYGEGGHPLCDGCSQRVSAPGIFGAGMSDA